VTELYDRVHLEHKDATAAPPRFRSRGVAKVARRASYAWRSLTTRQVLPASKWSCGPLSVHAHGAQTVRKRPLVGCPEHDIICEDCFGSYLSGKIESEEVVPYIRCPAEDCRVSWAHAWRR
jgi:hypothetical protein